MYVTGYRLALLVAGAGALIIAEIFSWKISFIGTPRKKLYLR